MYNITIEQRTSKKSGNSYNVLIIEFENGYKFETFLNNEQYFIIANILGKEN